jgi:hypothetical protein
MISLTLISLAAVAFVAQPASASTITLSPISAPTVTQGYCNGSTPEPGLINLPYENLNYVWWNVDGASASGGSSLLAYPGLHTVYLGALSGYQLAAHQVTSWTFRLTMPTKCTAAPVRYYGRPIRASSHPVWTPVRSIHPY